ncbi:MAG: hypothetical protein M3018_05760 [Actinomycetota bacterium]|nr:hypothetical protein [Actinomycetota bacterium]
MSSGRTAPADQRAGGGAQEKAQEVAGEAQEKAQQAATQAKGKVREQVDQRSSDLGQRASGTAEDLRGVAEHLRSQGKDQPAQLAEKAAERVDGVGAYLQRSDGERILRDVEDFGRQRPWAVVAGGLMLGFAASRFLKASSSERYQTSRAPGTSPSLNRPVGQGLATGSSALPPAVTDVGQPRI